MEQPRRIRWTLLWVMLLVQVWSLNLLTSRLVRYHWATDSKWSLLNVWCSFDNRILVPLDPSGVKMKGFLLSTQDSGYMELHPKHGSALMDYGNLCQQSPGGVCCSANGMHVQWWLLSRDHSICPENSFFVYYIRFLKFLNHRIFLTNNFISMHGLCSRWWASWRNRLYG